MIKFLPILFLFSSCSTQSNKTKNAQLDTTKVVESFKSKIISDSTNTLRGKAENLELEYIVWGCACANWVTPADFEKYQDSLEEHCIFIEAANKNIDLPMYFDPGRHIVKVSGQFYVKPDYPKGTIQGEEQLNKAKVFRYTTIEVLNKPDFKCDSKVQTITLSYNAISCTCAQWSESKFDNNPDKRVNYWLEPANKKLVNADTLFNGENLPVQIRVTGQIVSENGFPLGGNLEKVGLDEAGKVFRYTKIKVLKDGQKKKGY